MVMIPTKGDTAAYSSLPECKSGRCVLEVKVVSYEEITGYVRVKVIKNFDKDSGCKHLVDDEFTYKGEKDKDGNDLESLIYHGLSG